MCKAILVPLHVMPCEDYKKLKRQLRDPPGEQLLGEVGGREMLCCSLAGPEGDRAPRHPGRPPLVSAIRPLCPAKHLQAASRKAAGPGRWLLPLLAVRVRHPAGEETACRRETAGLHRQSSSQLQEHPGALLGSWEQMLEPPPGSRLHSSLIQKLWAPLDPGMLCTTQLWLLIFHSAVPNSAA